MEIQGLIKVFVMEKVAVVMDWGGTWVRAGVVDSDGNLLWHDRSLNKVGGTQSELISGAYRVLQNALRWCEDRDVVGVGIASAGPIDAESGIFYNPPNLQVLDGVCIKEVLEEATGYPIVIGNDATMAALGEYNYGAGRDPDDGIEFSRTLLYLTISTGVGGGVIDRGKMVLGTHGMAAEVGHMRIDSDDSAPACQCGNIGCLEALVSGTSIVRLFNLELDQVADKRVKSDWNEKGIDTQAIFEAANYGDSTAKAILTKVAGDLSVGITNLVHLFNPDLIVLGGGVSLSLAKYGYIETIRDIVTDSVMSSRHKEFRIKPAKLGDSAGLIGAACLIWEQFV